MEPVEARRCSRLPRLALQVPCPDLLYIPLYTLKCKLLRHPFDCLTAVAMSWERTAVPRKHPQQETDAPKCDTEPHSPQDPDKTVLPLLRGPLLCGANC